MLTAPFRHSTGRILWAATSSSMRRVHLEKAVEVVEAAVAAAVAGAAAMVEVVAEAAVVAAVVAVAVAAAVVEVEAADATS
jgi:hypothetical protein